MTSRHRVVPVGEIREQGPGRHHGESVLTHEVPEGVSSGFTTKTVEPFRSIEMMDSGRTRVV